MPKKVIVTVTEESVTRTDYLNFSGATCLDASKQFHVLLTQFGVHVDPTQMIPKPELLATQNSEQTLASQDGSEMEVSYEPEG